MITNHELEYDFYNLIVSIEYECIDIINKIINCFCTNSHNKNISQINIKDKLEIIYLLLVEIQKIFAKMSINDEFRFNMKHKQTVFQDGIIFEGINQKIPLITVDKNLTKSYHFKDVKMI